MSEVKKRKKEKANRIVILKDGDILKVLPEKGKVYVYIYCKGEFLMF